MPVDQTMTFTATPPTTGETPTTFNLNAISCWNELKLTTVPNLNTAFTQMNALESNVNAKEASTVYSADIASAAANFQGEWTSEGYTLGQSVSSGGTTYMCKLTHATGFVVTNTTYWQPTGYAAIVNGATAKTVPVDADIIGIGDSVSSFTLKKLTWANIKSTLLAYFNTIYVDLTTAQTVAGIKTFSSNPLSSAAQGVEINALTRKDYVDTKAPLSSPALTDIPTAPTAPAGTNTPQLATTAYVKSEIPNALNATGSAPIYACRAWVNFNGTGTVAIRASGNVSSITDNGVGNYTVNFTNTMPDVNYTAFGQTRRTPFDTAGAGRAVQFPTLTSGSSLVTRVGALDGAFGANDEDEIFVTVFR